MHYGKKHDLPFGIMDVAGLLRLNIRRRAPGQVYVDCPICGDRRGKMNLNTEKDLWRCNYCGEGGGMLSLYAKVYGVSNSDAYREICDALAVNGFSPDYTVPEKTTPAEAEQSDAASVQEVHQTLSMLLSMLTLIPAHREHLRSVRGLSDDEITRFGFKSTPPPFLCRSLTNRLVKAGCRVQGVPGFYVDDNGCWTVKFHQRTSGIIIPIFGVDGLIHGAQIRLDHPLKDKDDPPEKTGVKYLTLSSTGKRMGTTSGSPIHFVGDPCSRVVYVTEGCLKADVAHALMHRTFVATLGVNNTAKLDGLFAFLHRNGTEEIIEAEDMDKYSNEMVEKGASKIYALAARHGMRCRRLTWNPNYKGIDDWQLALRRKEQKMKEDPGMTFKEQYLNGLCGLEMLETCTKKWHAMKVDSISLRDYLGLTEQEYDAYLQTDPGVSFQELLDSQRKTQRFRVYQLDLEHGETRAFAFGGIDALHKAGFQQPPAAEYTLVYDGELICPVGQDERDILERIFERYNDLNQMVSKHVCGYEQKITRIYDYGYTYDKRGNLVKEEEICSPTTTGPKNITVATYLYDETNRMVRGTNKAGEVSAYTFNGLGVRVGTELILKDNTHGYTDFHCQTPSVETGIEKPEVVKTDYVIDYTRLDIDQRVLMKSEQDGYDFFYTYGLDKLQVMTIGEGSNWWGQSVKKCVNMAYVHTDRLGSVVNLSDQYGRVTARADYTDWGEVRKYTDITVDGGFRRLLPEITYATHEYDDVLNQFYAKARMYDAENKRFDAVDLIAGTVANPISLVQYLYVVDNPIKQIDPLGLIWIKYENIVSKRNNGEDASHSYSTELKKMQQMLNYMGYSNIPNGDMGVDYGGLTAAAVNLFQLNYQIKPTSFVNNTTYLTVANVYVNKRYSNKESQKAFYDLYVRQLMKRDGITNKDYYRKYVCVVPQGFSQSVLDNLPAGVSTKKVNGIWYFDYTDAMNKVLTENEKVVLEHQIPLYEDYVAEVGKNLTWFGRLVYNYNSAYQAKRINELLWFASMVKPNAEWDIKVEERWEAIFGDGSFYGNQFRFVFDDSVVTPEMMGNITYGYWGKALGVSDEMLYLGGGVANAGIEIWKLLDEYYGESEEDHLSVKWGIEYYNATH